MCLAVGFFAAEVPSAHPAARAAVDLGGGGRESEPADALPF